MKRRFLLVLMSLMIMLTATGCATEASATDDCAAFITVNDTSTYKIVYNKDTKVMYAVSNGGYSYGVFTLLVNADGTPMTYED